MHASVRSLVLVVAFAVAGPLHAASGPSDNGAQMDALRHDLAAGKRGLVEKTLQLTPDEAKKFWPLYDKFEHDTEAVIVRQNRSVLEYVQAETYLTNLNAKRIAQDMVQAESDRQRLREKQFKKVLSILPGKKAARYIQLESRIQTLTRYDMAQQLPLAQ